jgi:hypothetical protein
VARPEQEPAPAEPRGAEPRTASIPRVGRTEAPRRPDTTPPLVSRHAAEEEVAAALEPGHARLEQILAENAALPADGGRRRRRYREDDESGDDVLARVLGRAGT